MILRSLENKEITIRRKVQTGAGVVARDVATVPITEKSVRKFMLMSEDYIQLEFSTETAIHFAIGDYCSDIFGIFTVTKEQMPKYNTTTGGYDYSLKLEADYMVWKNWVHCLVADGQRMESRWSLTDRLAIHAQQIADGVNLIMGNTTQSETIINPGSGSTTIYTNAGYAVDVTAENAAEVKFLSYDGKDFISAMNMIADAWGCEWWVDGQNKVVDGVTYANTIHFGKCEIEGDAIDFTLGVNVETMDVSRDQQEYCNRVFAYGGTKNVPEDYDRSLVLHATYANTNNLTGKTTFYDSARMIRSEMIKGTATNYTTSYGSDFSSLSAMSGSISVSKTLNYPDDYTFNGSVGSSLVWAWGANIKPNGYTPTVSATLQLIITSGSDVTTKALGTFNNLQGADDIDEHTSTWEISSSASNWNIGHPLSMQTLNLTGQTTVEIKATWTLSARPSQGTTSIAIDASGITVTGSDKTASKAIKVNYGGTEYNATFNAANQYGTTDASKIRIDDAVSGFIVGSTVTIPDTYLNVLEVPYSFLSLDYSVGTLGTLGEKRIHLPSTYTGRYFELEEQTDMSQVVEQVVVFDDIYPKLDLKVYNLTTEEKTEDITHDDGSIERQNWTQYKFKAYKETEGDFTFNTRYIMDGNRLEAAFTAPQESADSGYMLSGMTFEVGFDNSTQVFTLVRNENYGAKLPNGIIVPSDGDTFFLTGWNPKAIENGLGLVTEAENDVETKSQEYLQAIKEGQFTFTTHMMSQWLFDLCAQQFVVSPNQPFVVVQDYFKVSNGYTEYALLNAGAKVRVNNDALPNGYKESRVIGYEYRLDMPFDTPTYIVGETEAYSRLKQIERELTKLS